MLLIRNDVICLLNQLRYFRKRTSQEFVILLGFIIILCHHLEVLMLNRDFVLSHRRKNNKLSSFIDIRIY